MRDAYVIFYGQNNKSSHATKSKTDAFTIFNGYLSFDN